MKKSTHLVSMMRTSDLSKGMTMRNAGENRRLAGHLQQLDLQLRSNLVNLQAEISELKLSRGRQRPRSSYTQRKTSSPGTTRRFNDHQLSCSPTGISALTVEGTGSESSKPFLPQISAKQTALVGKEVAFVERSHPPRSPGASRRRPNQRQGDIRHLSSGFTNELNKCRTKSTPDLSMDTSRAESPNSTHRFASPLRISSLEKDGRLLSRSSEDVRINVSPVELNERVRDFLKRPNTSSNVKKSEGTAGSNEVNRKASDIIPTINIEHDEGDETNEMKSSIIENSDVEDFLTDEELFRNSLLLKASRDDGLSRSLPDLSTLGFMDFNEVIDQRLRKVRDDLPSEREMRKIRYLRFRDEPAPLPLKEIFEKENHSSREHLDKIDE